MCIQYEPVGFDTAAEVEGPQGWLHIKSHAPGSIELAQEAAVEIGDQLTQSCLHGGIPQVFQAFSELWRPMWNKHVDTCPERWDTFCAQAAI